MNILSYLADPQVLVTFKRHPNSWFCYIQEHMLKCLIYVIFIFFFTKIYILILTRLVKGLIKICLDTKPYINCERNNIYGLQEKFKNPMKI